MSKTSLAVRTATERKKMDEISVGLRKKIDVANNASKNAEEKIKAAFDYAVRVDGYKKIEAAKVLYDRLDYSPQWIRKFLPDDAKMMNKARWVQSKRKPVIHATVIPSPRVEIKDAIILPKDGETDTERVKVKDVVLTIPKGRVKAFYNDILHIREKAEKTGLKLHSDLTVEVL